MADDEVQPLQGGATAAGGAAAAPEAEAPVSPSQVAPAVPLVTTSSLNDFLKKGDDDDDGGGGVCNEYIKSMVFGGLDGIITTFSVIAAGAGAQLDGNVVILMGFANLVSDGISMGMGDYFSEKSENSYIRGEKKREKWEMKNNPDGEVQEMVEIFEGDKKIAKDDAEVIVGVRQPLRSTLPFARPP